MKRAYSSDSDEEPYWGTKKNKKTKVDRFNPDVEWSDHPPLKEPKASSDSDGKVTHEKNRIYFHGRVCRESVMHLIKIIDRLNDDLKNIEDKYLVKKVEPEPVYLFITSFGGGVMSAMAAVDSIKRSRVPIYTVVDGYAASAATFMSIVGKKRFMKKRSYMLVHQLSSGMFGKYAEMEDDWNNCTMLMDDMKQLYTEHTKISNKKLNKLMKKDIWWRPETCLEYGLIDEVLE